MENLFLWVLKEARVPTEDELAGIVAIGARHVELRIPLAEALRAYHIGARLGWRELVALAGPDEADDLIATAVHVLTSW
ncbi:hypothetical protein ACIBHX_41455 [Nonomuraea sp. NPDC050536]|uniref:hypothetical protein n=1 Tax=Nonomuraea sp. NPDC050536 TaxID=3364366 RepID=UPI0037C68374